MNGDWLSLCWIANEMVGLVMSFGKGFRQELGLRGCGCAVVVNLRGGGAEGAFMEVL